VLAQRTAKETARNDSCVVTIVGYRGNSVYRVVASIPIWVTVTSLAIWVTCGRFLWKAPTSVTCRKFLMEGSHKIKKSIRS
jgi:hypothetical protein